MISLAKAKSRIRSAFKNFSSTGAIGSIIPPKANAGKLYEVIVLADLIERLTVQEGLNLAFVGGAKLYLRTSGGPIDPSYPHIEISRSGTLVARLFTDIEFLTLSATRAGKTSPLYYGDCHEVDLIIVDVGTTGYPTPDEIWLAVECKHTIYQKSLLRESLGVRRELSYLAEDQSTAFNNWPRATVPAFPPSCLMVCCSQLSVLDYATPGPTFGIDFEYIPV